MVDNERIIRDAIGTHGFLPPSSASALYLPETMAPEVFAARDWTRTRIKECGESVIELQETDKLLVRSMYANQRMDGVAPITIGVDRIPRALDRVYLREEMTEILQKASLLLPEGYQLVVLDGFRPRRVQEEIYKALELALGDQVRMYASPPDQFASHATGGAVDVGIAKNGVLVDMGVLVDEMGRLAHLNSFEGAKESSDVAIRDWRRYLYVWQT